MSLMGQYFITNIVLSKLILKDSCLFFRIVGDFLSLHSGKNSGHRYWPIAGSSSRQSDRTLPKGNSQCCILCVGDTLWLTLKYCK